MQAWQTRLNERKQQFLTKTRERISGELTSSLEQLLGSPNDRSALTRVNKHFHQLAGAGGIYEMTEFCNIAIAAEELCGKLLMNESPVGDMEQKKLRAFCEALLREVDSEQHKTVPASVIPVSTTDGAPVRKADVLLVDQNADRLVVWHRVFEEHKMGVRTVKSASGARGAMVIRVPDVLVINAPLPDSAFGMEVIQHLRSLSGGGRSVVLVVAEEPSFKLKIDAIKCGADGVLEADTTAKDLLGKIDEMLAGRATRQYKILSVEDDLEQAWFIKSTLESVGYSVLHIADPIHFEEALVSFAPDLVLLDIMLGEISGHDLARYVRRHEQFSRVPIVFLTTENQMHMHLESARAGGDEHLVKPIAPQLLVAAIAGRLERA